MLRPSIAEPHQFSLANSKSQQFFITFTLTLAKPQLHKFAFSLSKLQSNQYALILAKL